MTSFQWALAVFSLLYGLILAVVLIRSARAARTAHRQANGDRLSEFFVSGRDVGLWSAVATLGATEIGLITIAYNAQKGFNEGFAAFHIGGAALVGCLIVGLTGFIVRPLRRTGVLTIPEYYGLRYGTDVRVLGATVMAVGGILNMGLFLKVASVVLLALFGLEQDSASITMLMIALVGLAVAYTAFGGMRSVIATDVFQFVVMVIGLVMAILVLLTIVPLEDATRVVAAEKGPGGFDPLQNESFGPGYVLWMVFVAGIVSSAVWPTALSRALCIERESDVSKAYLLSSVVFAGRMVLPAFLGVLAFAYLNGGGLYDFEAIARSVSTFGDDRDLAATPYVLGQTLPPVLVAFVAVALFASFMSTQDGYLFCWSSIIARDILAPLLDRTGDAGFQIAATRIGIVVIAGYEIYWGLVYAGKEDLWDYLAVSGSIYFCSGIVLLAGGLYWQRATRRGALAALVAGFSAVVALTPVKAALGLDAMSAPAIGFAAIALSVAAFIIGSLSEPAPKTDRPTGNPSASG